MINSAKLLRFESGKIRSGAPAMGPLHCLCRLVFLLSLSVIRETVASPNDQCQFIFKEDSVLQVGLSQDDGAKVTMDLHAENKFKCAEACCDSEGEWCTLAVFHTKTDPEAMNCFLVQCVPDGSENNVCITKHVRHSGFISATVKHHLGPLAIDGNFAINGNYHGNRAQQPIKIKVSMVVTIDGKVTINVTDQKPRLLDHLSYSKVDANHRVRRSLYPDLLQENLSRNKIRSHIRPVSSSSMSDSSVSMSPVAPRSSSRSIASSSSIAVPQQSSPVSSSVSTPSSSPSSPPSSSSSSVTSSSSSTSASVSSSSSRSASQSLSLSSPSSSSTSSSLMPPSISPSLSSFMSSRSSKVQSHSISKTTVTSSFPSSNHGISSKEETISSSISSSSAPPSSNTATPPTSPAPVTTPSIPPPPPSSPDTPSVSVNTSAPPLAPISPPTSPLNSSSDASSNLGTSSSDVISANNSVEALNNLNADINSSLTSPSSNPVTTNVKPSSTTVAATDIPTQKPPKVQTTAKPSTKATTKPTTKAGIADTTPTPKWTSPVSLTASQMSDSNATQPINVTQSGQDGTESPGEVKHDNINRTTVTQTGILIVTLCFGIIFLLAMMVVVGKRWCEGYQRRKYSKVDYLINGYYS